MGFAEALSAAVASPEKKRWINLLFGSIYLLLIAAIVVAGYVGAQSLRDGTKTLALTTTWLAMAGALTAFLAVLGLQVHGRIGGALIDEMNLMSLSRFQLVAWTVLIVSAMLALGLVRAFTPVGDALDFTVPKELWQLLGITYGAAVGREVVHTMKKKSTVAEPGVRAMETAETLTKQGTPTTVDEVEERRIGTLYGNRSPKDANLVDMFQGVEVGNTAHIDMGKVQMFFFTIACLAAYGAEIFTLLQKAGAASDLKALPVVGSGLLAILTVSHAAYLGNKTVDHSNGAATDEARAKARAVRALPSGDPLEKEA